MSEIRAVDGADEWIRQVTAPEFDGRGTWIGLLPALVSGQDPLAYLQIGDVGDDPHVTLLHLGRNLPPASVTRLPTVVNDLATGFSAALASMSGVARFISHGDEGDPLVALIRHSSLRAMRSFVVTRMKALSTAVGDHARLDAIDRYDFTPHLTIRRVSRDATEVIPPLRTASIALTRVAVTRGGVRLELPLRGVNEPA